MNFTEYQQKAAATSGPHRWWPLDQAGTRLAIAALGLAGEAGELLAVLKETTWSEAEGKRDLFTKEAGDVCWYVAEITTALDLRSEFVHCQNWPRSLTACGGDICVEAAGVAEAIKKHLGYGHDLDRVELAVRLNRILAYVSQAGLPYGVTMFEVAEANLEKLAARYAAGFSPEASINRAA